MVSVQNNTNSLDTYNIFKLMGIGELSDKSKESWLTDINGYIFDKFFSERLDYLLTYEQMIEVRKMLKKNVNIKEILLFIEKLVPNLKLLLAEFAAMVKADIIRKHYMSMIEECEKMYHKAQSEQAKEKLRIKREKYMTALELSKNEEWGKIIPIMAEK